MANFDAKNNTLGLIGESAGLAAIKDLTAKLFYTYEGNDVAGQRTNLVAISTGSAQNALIFLPTTNEILVNGTFYGASKELISALNEQFKELTGANIEVNGTILKANELTITDSSAIGRYVKEVALREIGTMVDNTNIESETGLQDMAFIKVTPSPVTGSATDVPYGNEYTASKSWKMGVPVDGVTVIGTGDKISCPIQVVYMPAGSVYVLDGNPATFDIPSIVTVAKNSNCTIEDGKITQCLTENVLSVIDARDFTKDSLVDYENTKYLPETHTLQIAFKTVNGDGDGNDIPATKIIPIKMDDLVDIDVVEINSEDGSTNYLAVNTENDKDDHSEHPDTKVIISAKVADYDTMKAKADGLRKVEGGSDWSAEFISNIGSADAMSVARMWREHTDIINKEIADRVDAVQAEEDARIAADNAEKTAREDADTALDTKFTNIIDDLDKNHKGDNTSAAGIKYLDWEVNQTDGLVDNVSIAINVQTIADKAEDGVISLNKVDDGLATTKDIALVIEGVEQAIEDWTSAQINLLVDKINHWPNNEAWGTVTIGG